MDFAVNLWIRHTAATLALLTPQVCLCASKAASELPTGFVTVIDTTLETAAERARIQMWSNGAQNQSC